MRAITLRTFLTQAIILLATAGVLSGCIDSQSVTVRKAKMLVHRYEITDAESSTLAFSNPGGVSKCRWEYRFQPEIQVEKIRSHKDSSGCTAVFKVKKIEIHLELPFDIFTRKNASQKEHDHQDGYVKICRRFYRESSHAARKSGVHLIGKEITGHGKNEDDARFDAISNSSKQMLDFYKEKVVSPAEHAVAEYRKLTENGNNDMSVSDAIAKAMGESN